MIGLGLRLAVSGGREAIVRLVVLALAVGLGVGLLLTAVSAENAVTTQNNRHAWLWTGTSSVPAGAAKAGTAPLWWKLGADEFAGRQIVRVDVAATGPNSPVPPGIPRDPAPGQYYASPALAALLRSTPAGELANRYPGRLVGQIGDAALSSPDSLYIVVGRTSAQLAHSPDAVAVTSIANALPSFGRVMNPKGLDNSPPDEGVGAGGVDLIFSVVALALLTPVLIFIGTATRLSAARREQRFAAMRLAGARPGQISVLAAVESTVAAVAGVATGFGLFFLLRVPLAAIPFTGESFFPAELSLSLPDIVAVAIGVPVAAALVARATLQRVRISPLGVARQVTPSPPRAWRALPLLAGAAELGFFVVHGRPASNAGQVQALLPGFLLIMIGLVIAGPWLTMTGARLMARRASRPGALIAARRLADDPRTAFRAVSGLVLALFIATVAVADLTTQDAKDVHPLGWAAAGNILVDDQAGQTLPVHGQPPRDTATPLTGPGKAEALAPLLARLSRIRGVEAVIAVRADGRLSLSRALLGGAAVGLPSGFAENGPVLAGLVSCSELARAPRLGHCPAGASAVSFPAFLDSGPPVKDYQEITWPAVHVPARQLDGLGLESIDISTNGSVSAVERARTALDNANAYPSLGVALTLGEITTNKNTIDNAYEQLANVIILASLVVAGCTLAAAVTAGLADRKRPFSLLRLTGARLGMLRGVVALESAVPLLAVAVVSVGVGFGAAAMYANVMMQHALVAPGAGYYVLAVAGILASLGVIAATFPLLRRITGPEAARNE